MGRRDLEAKLEKVREELENEKKRHFDEPLFDLTKLKQALDKEVNIRPLDMKGYFSKIIRSPSRYEVIFDEALEIADAEEADVINKLKTRDEEAIYDFANNFVRQRKPLPQFFGTFDILGNIDDISSEEEEEEDDGGLEDKEVVTGVKIPGERDIKLIEQFNMDEGDVKGNILKNRPVFRSVRKSKPFISESEELKAKGSRRVRLQPIPFGNFKEERLKTCLQFYKLLPWIKDQVRDVFVSPVSDNFDDTFFIRSDYYEYVASYGGFALTSDEVEKFYRPKEKYFQLQCYGVDKYYDEDSDTLHITWRNRGNEEEYRLKVGILTENKGFIIQTADILSAEENFIDNWLGNSDRRREELLEEVDIPSDAKTVVKNNILSALMTVVSNADLLYTNRILTNIVEKMVDLSYNTRDFFMRAADLIVFINPNINFVSSVFAKRLGKMQYKPEILPLLSEKEKLPEIFADKRVPIATIEQVNNILHIQIQKVFEDLVNAGRQIRLEGRDDKIIIGLPEWKNACTNLDEVRDIPDDELIFYTDPDDDSDDVFCFPINDLLDKFSKEDIHNRYTGKDFSDAFVRRFLSVYSKPIRTERIVEIEERAEEQPVQSEGALIKLIKAELLRLENNLIEPEYFQEEEIKCFECKKPISVGESISSIYKGKKIYFCSITCFDNKKW